jgi:hypothetical protein
MCSSLDFFLTESNLRCAWATLDSFLQQPRRLVIAFIARNFECLPFILLLLERCNNTDALKVE